MKKKIFSTMSIWKMVLKHHTNSYEWLNIILQWAKNQKKRCNLGMPHYLPRNQLIRTICTYIPELEEGGEGWWPAHIGSKGLERPYHPYHYNFSQNPWFFQLKNNHPPRKNRIQMWLITYILHFPIFSPLYKFVLLLLNFIPEKCPRMLFQSLALDPILPKVWHSQN